MTRRDGTLRRALQWLREAGGQPTRATRASTSYAVVTLTERELAAVIAVVERELRVDRQPRRGR